MTGDGGQRRREHGLHRPGADLAVQSVHPGRLDADADLPGTGLRDLDVGLVQHFRAAETVEQDGFHDNSSICRPRWITVIASAFIRWLIFAPGRAKEPWKVPGKRWSSVGTPAWTRRWA